MTDRICAWPECGVPLVRRANEIPSEFANRETCCQSHGSKLGQWRAKQRNGGALSEPRHCVICKHTFTRRANEKADKFRRRQTCSATCSHTLKSQKQISYDNSAMVPWPKVTGETDWSNGFAAHNLNLPKEPPFTALPPDRQSYIGCSAAMLVRGAGE